MRDGYGHTTMSGIAADLGGSKTTLWTYFRSKQELFAAVVDEQVERYGEALRLELPDDGDPAETLQALGMSILTTILRPQIIALHRIVVGETGRFPELGQMLWDRGAERGHRRTEAWLLRQMEQGRLRTADAGIAAYHFIGLCQSGSFYRHLLGGGPRADQSVIAGEVRLAVQAFLRAYRADLTEKPG